MFHCHEYGNYATKCHHMKYRKDPTVGVGGDTLASQFELDFTLFSGAS